jgi:hypothetical protein
MIQRAYLVPEDLAAWNERSAHLAVAVGTEEIGSALSALLKIVVEFDAIFISSASIQSSVSPRRLSYLHCSFAYWNRLSRVLPAILSRNRGNLTVNSFGASTA